MRRSRAKQEHDMESSQRRFTREDQIGGRNTIRLSVATVGFEGALHHVRMKYWCTRRKANYT